MVALSTFTNLRSGLDHRPGRHAAFIIFLYVEAHTLIIPFIARIQDPRLRQCPRNRSFPSLPEFKCGLIYFHCSFLVDHKNDADH